ncbi:MAG: hypothetical protein BWY09_00352 [Candidatus Hydrogenedentes bacterium ADurb.Bin179]|nr:MAG: hypothetical protein BWY09_00352 [Candidatus Hydrogenedentes bacterium ADurb.Bin179]
MRLLDTGPDDHNRPHTLRTEFLWCDSEKLERIPLVLYGLQKDAWPETSLLTVTDATLKITSMPARLLAAALNQNSMVNKRVMVANYKTLTDKVWDGIDIALDNEYQPIKHPFAQTTRRSEAVTSTPAATTQRRKKSGVLRKIGRGVVFVLLLAMAGYIAFTHDWTGGDTSIKNVPEASLDEKTESLKNANRSLETKLGALENEIQSLRTENRDLQARSTESINREELQSKIESLTESINDLSPNQIIKELDGILKSIVKETPDSPIQKQQIYNLDK